jgi:hypothetical protein
MKSIFLGLVLSLSFSVFADNFNAPVGGVIKNRQKNEFLGAHCLSEVSCEQMIFALYERDGAEYIHLRDIGLLFDSGNVSHRTLRGIKNVYKLDDIEPEFDIDTVVTALPLALIEASFMGDYSIPGGVLSFVAGLTLLPVAVATDAVRFTGLIVAYGAVSAVAGVEDVAEHQIARNSYRSLVKASRKASHGKTMRMSANKFNKIIRALERSY